MTFPTQALALLLASGAAGAAPEYSPAFFWSPRASASPIDHLEHYGPISGPQVEHIATSLGNLRPEVYLVFVAEGLATQGVREHAGHLPSLERVLQKSATSLSIPFTTAHDADLFQSAPRVAASSFDEYFKTHASVLSNGVSDTIVVELDNSLGAAPADQLSAHDALIDSATRMVDAKTGGNYVALFTARGANGAHRRLSAKAPVAYLHTTPTLLTAQVVSLLLFIIFLCGFCCLFSLQTPARFEDASKAQ